MVMLSWANRKSCRHSRGTTMVPARGRDETRLSSRSLPQRLADGVATDRKAFTQFVFGGKLRPDRIHPVDDLLAQGAGHLQVAVIGRANGDARSRSASRWPRHGRSRRRATTLPSPSAETYRVPSGPAAIPANGPCGPENGGMPLQRLGFHPRRRPDRRTRRRSVVRVAGAERIDGDARPSRPRRRCTARPPVSTRMPCGQLQPVDHPFGCRQRCHPARRGPRRTRQPGCRRRA